MTKKQKDAKENYKNIHVLSICIVVFCVLVFHAFVHLQESYMKSELENKQKELQKTAQIKAETVWKKYSDMCVSLEALADNVKNLMREDERIIIGEIELLSKVGYFSYVGISDAKGNMIDSQGQMDNIKEREYFKSAMNGNVTISDVITSQMLPDDEIQVIALPIIRDKTVIGIVFGILNVEEMDILLENETGNYIYTQIVDSKGNYITRTKASDALMKNKNVWEDFEEYEFTKSNIDAIKEDIENQRSGTFSFQFNGEERVSFYMPLGISNYYIYSTTSNTYIKNRTSEMSESVILMMFEMFAATLILFCGIYQNNRFMHDKLKKSHKEAVSSVEMIKIAVQESNQYIFEYDVQTGNLRKKAGIKNELFFKDELWNVPDSIIESGYISDSSIADFQDLFAKIKNESFSEKDVKVETKTAVYWFKIRMKNIYDEKNQIINTVGIVEDITEKKMQEKLLELGNQEKKEWKKRAERDGLTGLYNAAALKTKTAEILESTEYPGPHVFVLMDLDNFKGVNDKFGHQYGDRVLVEVAKVLQQTFRRDDIIARLGGDEFAVLLVNAADYEVMKPIFQNLCDKLSKTYSHNGESVAISASLGIAIAPEQGSTFKELYQKSDVALYQVKNASKNGFKKYREEL